MCVCSRELRAMGRKVVPQSDKRVCGSRAHCSGASHRSSHPSVTRLNLWAEAHARRRRPPTRVRSGHASSKTLPHGLVSLCARAHSMRNGQRRRCQKQPACICMLFPGQNLFSEPAFTFIRGKKCQSILRPVGRRPPYIWAIAQRQSLRERCVLFSYQHSD